jgi:hypothetical protein
MIELKHEEEFEGRVQKGSINSKMGAASSRDRVVVPPTEMVTEPTGSVFRGIPDSYEQGAEAIRDSVSGAWPQGGIEREIQRRFGDNPLSLDDSKRQVLSVSGNRTSCNPPQEFQSSGQPSGESSGALRKLSQQSASKVLVAPSQILVLTDPPYGIAHASNHVCETTTAEWMNSETHSWEVGRP